MGLFCVHMPLALGSGAQEITGRSDLFGACPEALIGERYKNWHARDIAPLSYDVEFSKIFQILVRYGAARKTRVSIRFPHFSLIFWVFVVFKSGHSGGGTGANTSVYARCSLFERCVRKGCGAAGGGA